MFLSFLKLKIQIMSEKRNGVRPKYGKQMRPKHKPIVKLSINTIYNWDRKII